MIDLTTNPATLSPWHTNFYTSTCCDRRSTRTCATSTSREDGTFAVITTTGAYRANTSCDTIARLEIDNPMRPISRRPGSTTPAATPVYAVEIHDGVAYIGGHMRWVNNPFAGDRPGRAPSHERAWWPSTWSPACRSRWNPGRERGVGLFDYHVTDAGIWAGSDTDRWNRELRQRLAFFPWAGGCIGAAPATSVHLPNDIFHARSYERHHRHRDPSVLYRVNAGGPLLTSVDNGPDWLADTSTSHLAVPQHRRQLTATTR